MSSVGRAVGLLLQRVWRGWARASLLRLPPLTPSEGQPASQDPPPNTTLLGGHASPRTHTSAVRAAGLPPPTPSEGRGDLLPHPHSKFPGSPPRPLPPPAPRAPGPPGTLLRPQPQSQLRSPPRRPSRPGAAEGGRVPRAGPRDQFARLVAAPSLAGDPQDAARPALAGAQAQDWRRRAGAEAAWTLSCRRN